MNFINYNDMNEEFFSILDKELPNLDFSAEEQSSRKTFLSDPQPITSLFEDPNASNSVFSGESQYSNQTYESYLNRKDSSNKDKVNYPDPISKKSRKISKKEEKKSRGKKRKAKITESTVLAGEVPQKYIPEEFNQPDIDEKTRKKMLQAIRNRVAAQTSRDKKRLQFTQIEEQNEQLMQENLELKDHIKQLEESNSTLKQENEEYRKALEAAKAQNTEYFIKNDVRQNGFLENGFLKTDPFDISESGMVPSTESSNPSGYESPTVRRSYRASGFAKYSLALAMIFAVLMFNGINSPGSVTINHTVPTISEGFPTYSPSTKAPLNKGRMLFEPDLDDMDIETEGLNGGNHTCFSQAQEKFSYANHLGAAQQNYNEHFMSQFFRQLKIYEPIQSPENQQQSATNLPSHSTCIGVETKCTDEKPSGISSMFCPIGFELNREEDLNAQTETKPGKHLKLKDAEWLQLFIPKNNISLAESSTQTGLSASSREKSHRKNEDENKILEVSCKIFSIKELSSGF